MNVLAAIEAFTRDPMALMAALFAVAAIVWDLSRGQLSMASSSSDIAIVALYGGLISVVVLTVGSWFVHASGHAAMHDFNLPLPSPLQSFARSLASPVNILHLRHHDLNKHTSWVAWTLEVMATGIMTYAPLIPLALMGIPMFVVHPASLLVFCAAHSSVHLINYHFQVTDVHRLHHEDPWTNFGPNCVDVLFGTTDRVEDVWHMVPNVLLSAAAVAAFAWFSRRRPV